MNVTSCTYISLVTHIHSYPHIGECVICCVQKLYDKTKSSELPCDPSKLYGTLQKANRNLAVILNGEQQDAHEFFKLFKPVMQNERHPEMYFAKKFTADIVTNIECQNAGQFTKAKTKLQILSSTFIVKKSSEAFQTFFEKENVEHKCITCMKSVLATKQFMLLSTPEYLCIILNRLHNRRTKFSSNIEINRSESGSEMPRQSLEIRIVICR